MPVIAVNGGSPNTASNASANAASVGAGVGGNDAVHAGNTLTVRDEELKHRFRGRLDDVALRQLPILLEGDWVTSTKVRARQHLPNRCCLKKAIVCINMLVL